MSNSSYILVKPKVSRGMYWPESALLTLSFAMPIFVWLVWRDGQTLARSGSLMVFFAAVAEFFTLNRMNKKHLLNACRVRANETPWDFSNAAMTVGVVALVAALGGTVLWGYGALLIVSSSAAPRAHISQDTDSRSSRSGLQIYSASFR